MGFKRYIKQLGFGGLLFLSFALLSQCRRIDEDCFPLSDSQDLTQAPPGFPPIPFPDENAFTTARWELGKRLFYDPVLSLDSSISCGSCHHASLGFSDDEAFSPGIENRPGTRNASPLVNLAYHPYYLREGSVPTLEMQILVPIQEENEFAHNIVAIGDQLNDLPEYVAMAQAAYGRDPDPYVITRAIATFERTLVSGNSSYDQWKYQGCSSALSPAAARGHDLFFSDATGCSHCHGGFNFTEYQFENNGLYASYPDQGRMRLTSDPQDSARFKVPTLRNIAVTPPYMHDASFSDLYQVVRHYNAGGASHGNKSPLVRPLNLSDQEIDDLVAFLEALTDPAFLGNPLFGE